MKTRVKQDRGDMEVWAVADDKVVGVLKAKLVYGYWLDEYRHEAWQEACEECLAGQYDKANAAADDMLKAEHCHETINSLGARVWERYDEAVISLTSVRLEGWDENEDLEAALHLYRTAAVSAGRRQMPFMAEPCGRFITADVAVPKGLSAWVFQQPYFRRDMLVEGPFAVYTAQLALGSGRAANLRRSLLR